MSETGDTAAESAAIRVGAEVPGDPLTEAIFERVATETGGTVPNLYRMIASAPPLLEGWISYAWRLRAEAEVDRLLREEAILRTAALCGSDYVWRSHWRPARHLGATKETLLALADWGSSDVFSDTERRVFAMTDELVLRARVDNTTWTALIETFPMRHAVELVLTVAWYANVARVVNALGVPLEEGHERAPAVPTVPSVAPPL